MESIGFNWKCAGLSIEQLKMGPTRNTPGDDIWLQARQPSPVLIPMEHCGRTFRPSKTDIMQAKKYKKVSLLKPSDAGGKYGCTVPKDWSRQVYGRLLRAACTPSQKVLN